MLIKYLKSQNLNLGDIVINVIFNKPWWFSILFSFLQEFWYIIFPYIWWYRTITRSADVQRFSTKGSWNVLLKLNLVNLIFSCLVSGSMGIVAMRNIFYVIYACWYYTSLGKRPKTRPSAMNPVTILWVAYSGRRSSYE